MPLPVCRYVVDVSVLDSDGEELAGGLEAYKLVADLLQSEHSQVSCSGEVEVEVEDEVLLAYACLMFLGRMTG